MPAARYELWISFTDGASTVLYFLEGEEKEMKAIQRIYKRNARVSGTEVRTIEKGR